MNGLKTLFKKKHYLKSFDINRTCAISSLQMCTLQIISIFFSKKGNQVLIKDLAQFFSNIFFLLFPLFVEFVSQA
jgi:hypothetical protein